MSASTQIATRTLDQGAALARLAGAELAEAAGGIGAVHRAIARRAFAATGPAARPVQAAHDAITAAAYGVVRGGVRFAGLGAARAVAGRAPALAATPHGAAGLAVLNGLVGDVLEDAGSPLQEPMAVRVRGEVVPPSREALAQAFPAASGHLVVFLHGLFETEHSWRLGRREPYGDVLARELGVTPVYVRFNTGRRISRNGRGLSELLGQVVAAWPAGVERVTLVGHSMGGLVARSACHHASGAGEDWVRHVRTVVSLGSPHMGAPLEQGVHLLSAALAALPETRPVASFLRRRSGGIRDLHGGSLVDEDWEGRHADELRRAAVAEVPLLEGATHCFVSACVTRSPDHPVGRVVGDLLVLRDSASGRSRTRRLGFRDEDGVHVDGANHFALLNHPRVLDALRGWLA